MTFIIEVRKYPKGNEILNIEDLTPLDAESLISPAENLLETLKERAKE